MSAIIEGHLSPDVERSTRASSFVIYADLPNDKTSILLVHGYTGAYDRVSIQVAAYIRSLEKTNFSKPLYGEWMPEAIDGVAFQRPSDSTLESLSRRGYLTNKSVDEEQAFFDANVDRIHALKSRMMPAYVIMPTYQCNLRCAYCFQDHMRTDTSYAHLLRLMSHEMVDRVVDALPQIEERHGVTVDKRTTRKFTFFGGEPLLAESRPTIEYFMGAADLVGKTSFSAITNGTELESYEDLLGPGKISMVQITIDGSPEDHDRRRVYADGSGSFSKIARNIDLALLKGASVSVRMNVDRGNVDDIPAIAKYFAARGWGEQRGFSSYVAPVHYERGDDETRRLTLNTWELNTLLADMRSKNPLLRIIGESDDGLRSHAMAIFSRKQASIPMKTSFCGAHTGMYVFDPFGDIYACWEKTGDQRVRIGNIEQDGSVRLNGDTHDQWRRRTVTTNPVCKKCRFALHCGGGCAVLAEDVSGTMFSNYCDAFGKRFRARVTEAYQEFSSGNIEPAHDDRNVFAGL